MPQNKETRIQNLAFIEVGTRSDCMVWRQVSAKVRAYSNPEQVLQVGVPGMADSGLIVACTITHEMVGRVVGVAVQAEFKTDKGRQSPHQVDWQHAVESVGGVYRIVRTPDELAALVEAVKRGQW